MKDQKKIEAFLNQFEKKELIVVFLQIFYTKKNLLKMVNSLIGNRLKRIERHLDKLEELENQDVSKVDNICEFLDDIEKRRKKWNTDFKKVEKLQQEWSEIQRQLK